MQLVIFLVAGGLSFRAFAGCEWREGLSHSEYRQCLVAEDSRSVAEIVCAENALRLLISSLDEEDWKRRSAELLESSINSFKKFRLDFCEFEAATAAGGNASGDLRLLCSARLNRDFARRLGERGGALNQAH